MDWRRAVPLRLVKMTDSDDDDEHYQRLFRMDKVTPSLRIRDCDYPVIYDIRGKRSVVKGQLLRTHLRAELERVPQECLRMDRQDGSIVIHDNNEEDMILYISHDDIDLKRHTHRHHVGRRCIGIKGTNTVMDLQTILTQTYDNGDICLFFKDKRLDDMSAEMSSVLKTGSRVVCRTRKREDFICFYKPRANVERKYTINCWNTDNVSTIINIFHETFTDEFDGLSTGKTKVLFKRGKTMLKDDDFPCLDVNTSGQILDQGKIFVQVCPMDSFPVTIQVMGKMTENNCHLMFISLPMSSKYFRQEISVFTDMEPNAIQIRLKTKKLTCAILTEEEGLQKHCTVTVTAKPKILLICAIQVKSRSYKCGVQMFKFDTILHAKRQLAIKMKNHVGDVDVSEMNVLFKGEGLYDEDTLYDHRIRDGDTLNVHIFHDSLHLILRQPGQMRKCLTINNHRYCTVKDIKSYLAQCHRCSIFDLDIIFRERCLYDDEELGNLPVNSGDHVLVSKAIQTRKLNVKPVFFCGTDETMPAMLAVRVGGEVFTGGFNIKGGISWDVIFRTNEAHIQSENRLWPQKNRGATCRGSDVCTLAIGAICLDDLRMSGESDRSSTTSRHEMFLQNAGMSDEHPSRSQTSAMLVPITTKHLDEQQHSEERMSPKDNKQPSGKKRPQTSAKLVPITTKHLDVQQHSEERMSPKDNKQPRGKKRPQTSAKLVPITPMQLDVQQHSEERMSPKDNKQPSDKKSPVKRKALPSRGLLHTSVSAPMLSDRPGTNTIKRLKLNKELKECDGRCTLREESIYEEDVSHKNALERFQSSSSLGLRSPDSILPVGAPDTMPMLTQGRFEPHSTIIQESVLNAVALEIGQDWKRLAQDLGLKKTDIDDIEYQHSRQLRAQAFEALIRWRRRESRNATLERLKQALHNIEQSIIADSIDENIKYETN